MISAELDPKLPSHRREPLVQLLTKAAAAEGWVTACEWVSEMLVHDAMVDVHPWQVYALASSLAASPVDQASLRGEALFMLGRLDMKANTLAQEARKRSTNAKKGGRPVVATDDQISQVHAEWLKAHGHERGWKKEAARRLGISDTAVSKRWAGLKSSNKPG
jgi:hypothetical protein